MKKFKLLVATMLVAVMAFAFAACGGSPVVGEWEASYSEGDMSMSYTLDIDKDETFTMTMSMAMGTESMSESFEGTWTFEDDILTLSMTDGTETEDLELEYKDGKLVVSEGPMSFEFEKK